MKTFLKRTELSLENGGYLTSKEGKPVSNAEFHAAQKHAEFVVTLAAETKGKDFKGTKAVSLEELKAKVAFSLNTTEATEFIKQPKKKKSPTTDALKKEALEFVDFHNKGNNVDKINGFLQDFKVINEFETFGLFFTDDISKLNKVYTMDDVVTAVTSMVEILD